MTDVDARCIAVPAGYTIRLNLRSPAYYVVAAPAGTEPTFEGITRPGTLSGLFTHDDGVVWPNKDGIAYANHYLANGCAICLQFETVADALACHQRLVQERVQ